MQAPSASSPVSRAWRVIALVLAALVACAGLGVLGVAHLGWADVAATTGHSEPVRWFLTHARDSALDRQVDRFLEAGEMPDYTSRDLYDRGVPVYREHCVVCHGGLGEERSIAGRGLNPPPPDLAGGPLTERQAARSFRVLDHGLKMTGMPAYGEDLDDETLWALVAVQHRLGGNEAEEGLR